MITLPHPKTHPQIIDFMKPGFLAQVKLDGVRLALVYGEDCVPEYGITKGGIHASAPRIELPTMPPGTVLDGELVGAGSWDSAQGSLRDLILGRDSEAGWVGFDILDDPLDLTEDYQGFKHRVDYLAERGFPVLPAKPVAEAWEETGRLGLEGVVVRGAEAGPRDPSWKIKRPQELNVIVHKGRAMLMQPTGQPMVVASIPKQGDGVFRVSCEGVTERGKLRAARVIGPPVGKDVSSAQLSGLR